MTPILIIPGYGGSGRDHWQTHLEELLPDAVRVRQTDWDRPDLLQWMTQLAAAIEAWPHAVLVAHSLGCALVAHLARQRPELPIKAALLVAPADVNSERHTPPQLRGFGPLPLEPLPFRSILVTSTNDPFIDLSRARHYAGAWGARFVDIGACGHINVAAGFGPWPAAEEMVDELRSSQRVRRSTAAAWRGGRPVSRRVAG